MSCKEEVSDHSQSSDILGEREKDNPGLQDHNDVAEENRDEDETSEEAAGTEKPEKDLISPPKIWISKSASMDQE